MSAFALPPTPGRDTVVVRLQVLDMRSPPGELDWSVLDAGERDRARRFVFAADCHRYVKSHAFLRRVLGDYLAARPEDLPFTRDSHGKPRLERPARFTFNLSHTGALAAVAVGCEREVGIDAEPRSRFIDARTLARSVLSESELHAWNKVAAGHQRRAFLRFWCRKEAVLKACGLGLGYDPRLVDTHGEDRLTVPIKSGDGATVFTVADVKDATDYTVAVAASGTDWTTMVKLDSELPELM